jgi:imidazoleglycerol-phosphate dehydratase
MTFSKLCSGARANVHARVLYGRSNHHKIEALFGALRGPLARPANGWLLPSTKGLL